MTTILEQRHILSRSPHRSIWGDAWTHRQGIVGSALLLGFLFMAIFGSLLAPLDPIAIDLANPFAKPVWLDLENGAGLMGTDNIGRDVFSRVLVGSRISLLIGTTATILGLVIGIVMGLISGYRGGLAGDIIMRVADTQTAIPLFVLLIAAVSFIGGGLLNIILFLGIGAWVGYARLIRGEVLSIRERDFVEAARAIGANDTRIMFRHILPNAIAPVIVTATLSFGSMILTESALSFLGFGVSTLIPTWARWSPTPATISPPHGIPASSPPWRSCWSSSALICWETGCGTFWTPGSGVARTDLRLASPTAATKPQTDAASSPSPAATRQGPQLSTGQ